MAFLKTIIFLFFGFALTASGYEGVSGLIKTCPHKQESLFLNSEQVAEIKKGDEYFNSSLHQRTIYSCKEGTIFAYIQTDIVRTLPQTLIVYINGKNQVINMEIKEFAEPKEYIAPKKWLGQFIGKIFSKKLKVGHDIDGLTGATLTADSTNKLVRRSLLIHQAISK